jgi:FKBP-type peptidyl-prolyl cis-trans isomerase
MPPSSHAPAAPQRALRPPRAGLGLAAALAALACQSTREPLVYQPVWTASGIVVIDLLVPTDPELRDATWGDRLSIHFEARLADGTLLDSSHDRGLPVEFILGAGEVPPGLEEGLLGMRELGRRRLIVPSALAFGEAGIAGQVPGGAEVRFEIELIDIQPQSENAPAQP